MEVKRQQLGSGAGAEFRARQLRARDMLRGDLESADLEAAIRGQETELERVQSSILKQKLSKKIQSLRADLALKRAAIGEDVGDDL